jgi:hypothetical protein
MSGRRRNGYSSSRYYRRDGYSDKVPRYEGRSRSGHPPSWSERFSRSSPPRDRDADRYGVYDKAESLLRSGKRLKSAFVDEDDVFLQTPGPGKAPDLSRLPKMTISVRDDISPTRASGGQDDVYPQSAFYESDIRSIPDAEEVGVKLIRPGIEVGADASYSPSIHSSFGTRIGKKTLPSDTSNLVKPGMFALRVWCL